MTGSRLLFWLLPTTTALSVNGSGVAAVSAFSTSTPRTRRSRALSGSIMESLLGDGGGGAAILAGTGRRLKSIWWKSFAADAQERIDRRPVRRIGRRVTPDQPTVAADQEVAA